MKLNEIVIYAPARQTATDSDPRNHRRANGVADGDGMAVMQNLSGVSFILEIGSGEPPSKYHFQPPGSSLPRLFVAKMP